MVISRAWLQYSNDFLVGHSMERSLVAIVEQHRYDMTKLFSKRMTACRHEDHLSASPGDPQLALALRFPMGMADRKDGPWLNRRMVCQP
jgi:hypothetical protein